jgi:hypothetical protein
MGSGGQRGWRGRMTSLARTPGGRHGADCRSFSPVKTFASASNPVGASVKDGAGGETEAHRELKRLALDWARAHRLGLGATEVRLPRSGYRADVAAASPGQLGADAVTAVFECKASRADFRRDAADERRMLVQVRELAARLDELNALIGAHRPDLRKGDELFPEFECIDLRGTRHATHQAVTRELRAAQAALHEGTKFAKLARWRAATFLYMVVETEALVAPHEIPAGWGLLVREGAELRLVRPPERNEITLEQRIALLERIAARGR